MTGFVISRIFLDFHPRTHNPGANQEDGEHRLAFEPREQAPRSAAAPGDLFALTYYEATFNRLTWLSISLPVSRMTTRNS